MPLNFPTKTVSVLCREHQALRFWFSSCQPWSCPTAGTAKEFPCKGMKTSAAWQRSKVCKVAMCSPTQRLQLRFAFGYRGSHYSNTTFK